MVDLNTHQLYIFLVAAESMNFSQTAQQLQISQPSVSQNIQSLEEHLGVSLFSRVGRNVELSEAGAILLPLVREVLFLCEHIDETAALLKGELHGHLIIGCSTPTGKYILPKLLALFHRKYPQVRATCMSLTRDQAIHMLSEGKLHFVFTSDLPNHEFLDTLELTSEKVILIGPPNHPWSGKSYIDIEDILQHDFILPEDGSDLHSYIRSMLAEKGISIYQLNSLISLGNLESIALSVKEGLGIAFIPSLVATKLVGDQVISVKIRDLEMSREIYISRNKNRVPTPAQEAFWEIVTNSEIDSSIASGILELQDSNL